MTNNLKIVLNGPQYGVLDIDKNTELPLTFGIGDIRDISKKTGTFSKTIELAGTKNNNLLLNNYFDVNIQAGTFNINKLQKCQILRNGVPILDNAYIQLLSVTKVQNIGNNEELVKYQCVIKDDISNFFNLINNKELTDIELGFLDHTYNAQTIISTLENTYEDKFKYFFSMNDSDTLYNLNQFKPAVFAKTYFDYIFDNAGYTYTWDTFSGDTVQFQNLIIPYNGPELKITEDEINNIRIIVNKSGNTNYSIYSATTDFETVIQDNDNNFDETTGTYTNPFYIDNGSSIIFELNIEFDIELVNNETNTVYLVSNGGYSSGGQKYVPKLRLRRDEVSGPISFPVNNLPIINEDFSFTVGDTLSSGQVYTFGSYTRNIQFGTNNALPDDIFNIFLGFGTSSNNFFNQLISSQPALWRNSNLVGGTLADVAPRIVVKDMTLTIRPSIEFVGYNNYMRMNSIIPKKIKQSDFVKGILSMYNLFVIKDEEIENNLILKHRDEFYDSGEIKDWSKKLAKNIEQELIFLPDLVSKKLILSYKQDDNDIMMKGYLGNVKEIYGQLEFTFENEYVRNIETKDLVFSPVVIGKDDNGNYLPFINSITPNNNIKIALNSKNYESTNILTIKNFESTVITGGTFTATTVPLISHFNDGVAPSFDINYGINDYYFYKLDNQTNNNLYNLFWRRTLSQINNGKMFIAYFDLNENDINSLKLNDKIFVNNAYWYINKIIDFKANKNELTQVELLSVEDELSLSTPDTRQSVFVTNGDSVVTSIRSFNYDNNYTQNTIISQSPNQVYGKNNLINGTNTIVYGDNNNVTGTNAFIIGDNNFSQNSSFIFGSNNIVDENTNNIILIGNGISAATNDTLYVPNIILPSGGTINGVSVENIELLDLWADGTGTESIRRNNATATIASGNYSYSEGQATTASGAGSHAEGFVTTASGDYSHSEGRLTIASGDRSHAEGFLTTASGDDSHAEGGSTQSIGINSHAEGNTTIAIGDASHTEGYLTLASGDYSHAEGQGTEASGFISHSEGLDTIASGDFSYAGGVGITSDNFNEWSRGYVSPLVNGQCGLFTLSNQTTNDTPTELFLDGSNATSRFSIITGSVYLLKILLVARDNSGNISTWEITGTIKNNAGTTSIVGTPIITLISQDAALTTTVVTLLADNTNDSILVQVTGIAATTIKWNASVLYSSIKS